MNIFTALAHATRRSCQEREAAAIRRVSELEAQTALWADRAVTYSGQASRYRAALRDLVRATPMSVWENQPALAQALDRAVSELANLMPEGDR